MSGAGETSTTDLLNDAHQLEKEVYAKLQSSKKRRRVALILGGLGVACVVIGCIVGLVIVLTSGGDSEPAPVEEPYVPSPRISYPGRVVFNKANWNNYKKGGMPDVYKDFKSLMAGCSGMLRIDQICGWKNGKKNMAFVDKNPSGGDQVMRVSYPRGEYGTDGGSQFYQRLKNLDKGAMLEYEVYFPKNFDFVMGGKLPGFHGGNLRCSGYDQTPNGKNCFSTRLMWRENGEGEAYMYVPLSLQDDSFCKQCTYPVASKCSAFKRYENCSWNRGTFKFAKGSWTRVSQYIKMNTPGKKDGVFEVYINGSKKMSFSKMVYRSTSSLHLDGLYFSTFMGGHSRAYAPGNEQGAFFRNFKVYAN